MRIFIASLCLIIISSVAAHATPITKQAANAYYQNCTQQPAEGITQKSKEYMCACTAAQMMDNMQVEDVKAMAQQNAQGRHAMNKMIIDVYAPCMEYPAYDHYYNNCITDPKTKTMSSNPERTCSCLADQVAGYLKENSQSTFRDILRRTPDITDPMGALTSDSKFQQFAKTKLLGCVIR